VMPFCPFTQLSDFGIRGVFFYLVLKYLQVDNEVVYV